MILKLSLIMISTIIEETKTTTLTELDFKMFGSPPKLVKETLQEDYR